MSLQDGDEYLPVAMLDDDPKLHGKMVKGLEGHAPSELEALCRQFGVKHVLLAALGWQPEITLEVGIASTHAWDSQICKTK